MKEGEEAIQGEVEALTPIGHIRLWSVQLAITGCSGRCQRQ